MTTEKQILDRIPFVTIGILGVLIFMFHLEQQQGSPRPSLQALIALGGISRDLVFEQGQWWRIFTAPLLHVDLNHIVSNSIPLLVCGILFEHLVGRSWFAAIFAVGAVAGTVASVTESSVVSVGASGAIMALLGSMVICGLRYSGEKRGRRMLSFSLYTAIPSLFPLAAKGHVDYAAHGGGAAAGMLLGLLLQAQWPLANPLPQHRRQAAWIAIGIACVALLSVVLGRQLPAPVTDRQQQALIPYDEMPRNADDGIARAADLENRYPTDPRSHMYHAMAYLKFNEIPEAQSEFRYALTHAGVLDPEVAEKLRPTVRLLLALTMSVQRRFDDARAVLEPGDCALAASPSNANMSEVYQNLKEAQVCG
jgi:rhomboid protease GluP